MNLLFNGLSLSSIILLASLGLAITFGLMRVINMAHGEFMMIGAYTSYVVQKLLQTWLGKSGADVGYFLSIHFWKLWWFPDCMAGRLTVYLPPGESA